MFRYHYIYCSKNTEKARNASFMDSRLRQVLNTGMKAALRRQQVQEAASPGNMLTNPNDPIFLLLVINEVPRTLDNIREPVNPSDVWGENAPAHLIAEYNHEMQEIKSRRAALQAHRAVAEANLQRQLSPFLQTKMEQILAGTIPFTREAREALYNAAL